MRISPPSRARTQWRAPPISTPKSLKRFDNCSGATGSRAPPCACWACTPPAGRKAASRWICWAKRATKSGSGRWPRRTGCATSSASPRFHWRRRCGANSRNARTKIRHPCRARKRPDAETSHFGRLFPVTPGEEADDGFGVFDLAPGDHVRQFLALEPAGFDALVVHRSGLAGGEIFGEEDGHTLLHEAGARPERRELAPPASLVAGLFLQFAFGCLQGLLAGVEASRRQFPKILVRRQAVLAHQQHALFVVDGHHHRAADVPHHAAFDLEFRLGVHRHVLGDAEEAAIVDLFGTDDFHDLDWRARANSSAPRVFKMSSGPSHPRRAVTTP